MNPENDWKNKEKEINALWQAENLFLYHETVGPPQPPTPHVRVKINYIESWLAKDPQGANQTHTKKEEEMGKKKQQN